MADVSLILQHHLIVIDANLIGPLDSLKQAAITADFIKELLDKLEMEKLGPLQVYDATDLRAPGWSFLQPITTSHVGGHYFEKPGDHPHLHLDIYSCKRFAPEDVVRIAHKHWQLRDWAGNFVEREMERLHRKVLEFGGFGDRISQQYELRNRS